ncbi:MULTISPECIES: T7SS effector LXG polymorphic toxin [unclassified Oceanobacillus]|uniref:T7SS effector LXG polymorphic toxin n=1 Tax=unclassified Oceanobacillus TaxID=2630292 RepID=UPI001BE83A70|nr:MULTISPECIES: T7SS effector LXG polymorphic toxin [unclassified Oceanobacillus]MBT2600032.1 hypothetical protein [Oceanobacillus sp. ISL-74]MBT2652520.1 hypothetical protein [Oceanobacillus sp. ISL-73]
MKTIEASTIHEGIEQTTKLLSELANQVAEVHGKITGILNTESDFSGQAASSIRAFYKDIHAPLAVYLEGIVREYHDILRQIQQLLYELDRSEQAFIDEDFLKTEMKRQLNKAKEQTAQLTDETNDILRSVRDIIHLSDLSDDQFIHSVEKTESKVNKTIEKLYQFDQEATHKLTTTENDVDLLENYLSDIQSLTKDHQLIMTSYQANSITQLDVHQQMIAGLIQKTIPKDFVLDIFRSITNSSYLAMGNTAASIVRAQLNDTMSMTMDYRMRALATIVDTTSPVMLEDEYKSLDAKVVSSQSVRDYKGEYYGNYLTLQDGRIVRSFMDHDGVMKYHFVGDIPEERLKPVEEDKSLWDHTVALSKKVVDGTVEIGGKLLNETVNSSKKMWDGAFKAGDAIVDGAAWTGEKTLQGGKAAIDFLFLDDMKTLVDDEATVGEKAMAGFFLLPIGKFGKAGKLVKEYDGFKVTSKGEIPAKKSGSANKGSEKTSQAKTAEQIIADRTKGLDLNPHAIQQKQLSAKKMKELRAKIENRTITNTEYEQYTWNKKFTKHRSAGVADFWYQERQRILNNETPTRDWNREQLNDILKGKKPKVDGEIVQGHHSYSASQYPHLANKGEIIYPATPNEHLRGWHGGNWKNSLPGKPINPIDDF